MINLIINGAPKPSTSTTLEELLIEQGFVSKVATARNGAFVPAALRATTAIQDGDRIEILAAMQGG